MKRKIISAILTVTMLITVIPADIYAEENAEFVSVSKISEESLIESDDSGLISNEYVDTDYSAFSYAAKENVNQHIDETIDALQGSGNSQSQYIEGEAVCLAETAEEAEQAASAFGGTVKEFSYGVATISLPDTSSTLDAITLSADLSNNLPAIWPNYIDTVEEIETDPYLMEKSGTYFQWFHDAIGSKYAFAKEIKGQNVKVAVLDTGIRESHNDISMNALPGKDFYNGSNGKPYSQDPHGHGSHVAGIIAADDNNLLGTGIAPDAKVVSYRVANASGSATQSDIMRAINAVCEDESIKIINISIGGYTYNGAYEQVIKNAKNHGIALFSSAGNDGLNSSHFPSSYDGAISIAASEYTGAAVYFSNYGKDIDFVFPGYRISSLSNKNDYSYIVKNGTSMASPMAAGVAAVILSAHPELNERHDSASVDELLKIMKSAAVKSPSDGMGAGTTYIPNALSIDTKPEKPEAIVVMADGKEYSDSEKTATLSKVEINAAEILVQIKTTSLSDAAIYYTLNGKNPNVKDSKSINCSGAWELTTSVNGASISGNVLIKKEGKKSQTLKAVAVNKKTGETSKIITKTFVFSPYPSDVNIYAKDNDNTVLPGGTLKLLLDATPEKAVIKNGRFSCNSKGITVSNSGQVKADRNVTPGNYEIFYTCEGLNKTVKYEITVVEKTKYNRIDTKEKKITLSISENRTDSKGKSIPDADILSLIEIDGRKAEKGEVKFSSSNKSIATVDKTSGKIYCNKPGKATILATLSDGSKKTCKITVEVKQPVYDIELTGSKVVAAGKAISLSAKVFPENASNKKVRLIYKGTDNAIKISGMKVSTDINASGEYEIEAEPLDGGSYLRNKVIYKVLVTRGCVTSITDKKNIREVTLYVNAYKNNMEEFSKKYSDSYTLNAKAEGESISSNSIEYVSDNENVAVVDSNGLVQAKGAGKTRITVRSVDGSNKKFTYTVNVKIPMSGLKISPSFVSRIDSTTEMTLAKGGTAKMVAVYYKAYGKPTDTRIKWSSDNDLIKIDSKGVIKVDKKCPEGATATITAKGYSDNKVESTYTVKIKETPESSGFYRTQIKSGSSELSVYLVVTDIKVAESGKITQLTNCSYEAVGVNNNLKFTLRSYKDSSTGIKGYIPYCVNRTSALTYEQWNSEYNSVRDNKKALNKFYEKTGKKMRIVCRMNDGTKTSYYKEFWCFRIPVTFDTESSSYYNDKNIYIAVD